MKIITKATERYRELDKRYSKGIIESIYGSPTYTELIKKLILFKTSDNLYFVKNIYRKPITNFMFYREYTDIPELTFETFIDYHHKRNPNLTISNEYWLRRVVNIENDNLTYYTLETSNKGDIVRQLTDKETEMVNKVVGKALTHFDKILLNYWEKHKDTITCYCERDIHTPYQEEERFQKRTTLD